MRHLNSLLDLSPSDVETIFAVAHELKARSASGDRPQILRGHVLTQVFEKPSLRTRLSFDAAMMQLGGNGLFLTAQEAGIGGREAVKLWDVGTRQELLTFGGKGSLLEAARWTADGDVILAGPPWQAWSAPSWEEIAAAETKEKAR